MAVLIPNIDIPESCRFCPLTYTSWDSMPRCIFSKEECKWLREDRPSGCPLIEVKVKPDVFALLQEMTTEYTDEEVQRALRIAKTYKDLDEQYEKYASPNDDIIKFIEALSDASGVSLKNEDGTYKSPLDFSQEISDWLYRKDKNI